MKAIARAPQPRAPSCVIRTASGGACSAMAPTKTSVNPRRQARQNKRRRRKRDAGLHTLRQRLGSGQGEGPATASLFRRQATAVIGLVKIVAEPELLAQELVLQTLREKQLGKVLCANVRRKIRDG
jgi:hypothetical protein